MSVFFKDNQIIHQLEKQKGGYCYVSIPANVVNNLENKRKTRLICTINEVHSFQCGLNHLGDGNYFIIIGTQKMKEFGIKLNDNIDFSIALDPNPLGVEIPEVLEAMLTEDSELRSIFEQLTMGKKRNLIFSVLKIKDFDKQVVEIEETLLKLKSGKVKDIKVEGSQRRWGV
jgi:Domain of unknown function (DUF1905)/Bacteriocin-protection, YdeI or OmpD-Associated